LNDEPVRDDDPEEERLIDHWHASWVICTECEEKHLAVWPSSCRGMECPECGAMACRASHPQCDDPRCFASIFYALR
jgi:hypothetical protein